MVRAEFLDRGLREAGYKTALFGKWHLGAGDPFEPTQQGFDSFLGHRGGFIDNYCHYFLHGKGFHDLYEGKREVFREGDYFPDMVTDRALEFIEKNQDNPCFLYLAFNIPHYPDQAITAMDWMPTMLRLCGVQRPDLQFDGHDILPVVQEDGPSPNTVMHWQWVSLWAVREGDWKLVQNRNVPLALYNLADEKPEQEDYMETHPAIASRLQAQHDEWLKEVMPEPDRTLFSLPENNAAGLVVRNAKRPNDAKVDQIAGTLFECGDAEDRVALYRKRNICALRSRRKARSRFSVRPMHSSRPCGTR